MKKLTINGSLRIKNNKNIALTLYSTPLARFLIDNDINFFGINYDNINEQFIIEHGDKVKITTERIKENKPLCVLYVSKIIGPNLRDKLKKERSSKKVKVVVNGILSKEELLNYNKLISYTEPNLKKSTIIPKSEIIDLACHISCFRNKNSFCYRITSRHRILEDIAQRKERIMILRDKKGRFIIKKDQYGRLFNLHKSKEGYPTTYMQISPSLIKEEENELFNNGRRCFSSRILLSEKEFNLDISHHFLVKEERELAYELTKRNINIKIPQMGKREADIILKDSNAQIEITNLNPRKENSKNNPHGEGAHINARFGEGFLRVTKNIIPYYFLVINKNWKKFEWVKETCRLVQPKVITIFTDFQEDWTEKVAKKIESKINMFENDN